MVRQGPAPRSRKAYKRSELGVDYLTKVARQMVNPDKIVAPCILPDPGSNAVCARKYQRTVTFKRADYAALKVAMFPNLYLPGFVAGSSDAVVIPASAAGPVVAAGQLDTNSDTGASGSMKLKIGDRTGETVIGLALPLADAAGAKRLGFTGSFPTGNNFTATVKNISPESKVAAPTISFWFATDVGNWTEVVLNSFKSPIPRTESITSSGAIGANYTKFGVLVTGTNDRECKLEINLTFSSAQVGFNAGKSFAPAFSEQIVDNAIEKGRVTHMSMYCRNTTAEAYTSGSVTSARVPANFNLASQAESWTQLATRLPENRYYTGKLATGTYCFWVPEQLDEFQIDNVSTKLDTYRGSDYLILEIPEWVENASVQVTFTWIVEFYTPNQNFEKIMTQPMDDDFRRVWHYALNFPAAMCNPEHTKDTADFVQSVRKGLKSAYGFYKENAEVINMVGEAMLAAIIAT